MATIKSLVDLVKTYVGYWSTPVKFYYEGQELELVGSEKVRHPNAPRWRDEPEDRLVKLHFEAVT